MNFWKFITKNFFFNPRYMYTKPKIDRIDRIKYWGPLISIDPKGGIKKTKKNKKIKKWLKNLI